MHTHTPLSFAIKVMNWICWVFFVFWHAVGTKNWVYLQNGQEDLLQGFLGGACLGDFITITLEKRDRKWPEAPRIAEPDVDFVLMRCHWLFLENRFSDSCLPGSRGSRIWAWLRGRAGLSWDPYPTGHQLCDSGKATPSFWALVSSKVKWRWFSDGADPTELSWKLQWANAREIQAGCPAQSINYLLTPQNWFLILEVSQNS